MACYTGTTGALEFGTLSSELAVAQVQNWTITHTQETLDNTVMGNTYRSFCAGLRTWEGSAEVVWTADEDDNSSFDEVFQIADSATRNTGHLIAYWDNTAGNSELKLSGNIIITSIEYENTVGELNMATVNFTGTGALTVDSTTGA